MSENHQVSTFSNPNDPHHPVNNSVLANNGEDGGLPQAARGPTLMFLRLLEVCEASL